MEKTKYIWQNGEFVDWDKAQIHVLTHALHYGTGVFEGIRAYQTAQGPAIFRAQEHYQRLLDSAKIYQIPTKYKVEELIEINQKLIQKNEVRECYIRPIIFYGYGKMGLYPEGARVDTVMALWPWGTYLGEEGLKKGIRCKISSWERIDSRILPPLAKCSANYINSVLAKSEALNCGYDEAILLNVNGQISEGPGENILLIKNGKIFTPPVQDNALLGITCQSVIDIAKDLGYEVVFKSLIRDELFLADELFFTGTAAEITPIREVDGRTIGQGKRGPITKAIQEKFFEAVKGQDKKYEAWLTYC
jgi:branched-chain amino acid aminotransferase